MGQLALVDLELCADFRCFTRELSIATLTDSHRGIAKFYKAEFAPQHAASLTQSAHGAECL